MNFSLFSLALSFFLASSAVRAEEDYAAFAGGLTPEQVAEQMRLAEEAVHEGDSAYDKMDFGSFDEAFWNEGSSFWENSDEDL